MNKLSIGHAAEKIAFDYEQSLSSKVQKRIVRLVSNNSQVGYDLEVIESIDGEKKFKAIEVKAWNANGHFYITSHEIETLKKLGAHGWIYIVDVNRNRIIKMIQNPFAQSLTLEPISFKCIY